MDHLHDFSRSLLQSQVCLAVARTLSVNINVDRSVVAALLVTVVSR